MWYLALLIGLVFGLWHGQLSFNETLKSSQYYIYIAMCTSTVWGLLWALIAKSSTVAENVYKYGSAHDGAIVLAWYIGSIFIYKMNFSITEYIAIGFIVIGTLLLKVAG